MLQIYAVPALGARMGLLLDRDFPTLGTGCTGGRLKTCGKQPLTITGPVCIIAFQDLHTDDPTARFSGVVSVHPMGGCESWTLTVDTEQIIQAFQSTCIKEHPFSTALCTDYVPQIGHNKTQAHKNPSNASIVASMPTQLSVHDHVAGNSGRHICHHHSAGNSGGWTSWIPPQLSVHDHSSGNSGHSAKNNGG